MIYGVRFTLVLMGLGYSVLAAAQGARSDVERYVIAYRTEIHTEKKKIKGVLEQVTDSNVVVRNDQNGYDYISAQDIVVVRIKFSPDMATYAVQNFYGDVDDLDKTPEGFIDLHSPRNQRYLERSPVEEVLGNVFFNEAGILGTRGLNRLRKGLAGTITKFRVNGDLDKYARVKPDMQLYALQYQLSPEYDRYLRDAISSGGNLPTN